MNNLLTASRMTAHLQCQRAHYWKFEAGLRPVTDARALRMGSAWHTAMEARWKGLSYEEALASAVPECIELDEQQVATISGLLAGYYQHYRDNEVVKQLHPEVEFKYSLQGSRTFEVAGKIDGLAVLHDGRLALVEHKTTSESVDADSDYWLRLRFNGQLYQYVLAARQHGWNIETIIYDVTRKPSIAPREIPHLDEQGKKIVLDANGARVFKKDGEPRESGDKEKGYTLISRPETPEEFCERLMSDTVTRPDFYFARREVPILEQDLQEFEVQRLQISKQILSNRAAQKRLARPEHAWPRNVTTMSCKGCAYQSFCLQNCAINLDAPPAGFIVGNHNPELSQAEAA